MVYTDGTALVADTIEELHAFAQKCGVFTFYDHRRRPHYVVDRKISLPTVMAHGAKRVKNSELVKLSNAMAKKREAWYVGATDEEIREKIRVYAPWHPKEMIFYEGQEMTQAEMFEIWFQMFKDLQDGKNVSAYKLPKVMPLNPRKDPPTDREILADLYAKIEHGKQLKAEEEAKPVAEEGVLIAPEDLLKYQDPKRLVFIAERMQELYDDYDPLEVVIQKDAIAAIQDKIALAQEDLDQYEDANHPDAKPTISKISNLKVQLQALNERLVEIEKEQAPRVEARKEKDLSRLQGLIVDYQKAETSEERGNIRSVYIALLADFDNKYGGLRDYDWYHDQKFGMEMDEKTRDNPEYVAERKRLEEEGSLTVMEGEESSPYKVVYDPANPKEGESYKDVEVDKLREAGLIPPPTPPEMLGGFIPGNISEEGVFTPVIDLSKGKYFKKVLREQGRKRSFTWYPDEYELKEGEVCERVFVTNEELDRFRKDLDLHTPPDHLRNHPDPAVRAHYSGNTETPLIYTHPDEMKASLEMAKELNEMQSEAMFNEGDVRRNDDPELVKQLEDRAALLEECERLGIQPPPPGYGYLWDKWIPLEHLEKIDYYIRKEFGDTGIVEKYHELLKTVKTWDEAAEDPEGRFITSIIERNVPPEWMYNSTAADWGPAIEDIEKQIHNQE